MNLCEILKGHEGETFYSPCYGYITLKAIKPYCYFSLFFDDNNSEYKFTKYGKISTSNDAECVLFPSKDQRDWNKWIEEHKVPKTWSDYIIANRDNFDKGICDYCIDISGTGNNGWTRRNTPIEKSALALLKIHQLIEVGYGRNVTNEEWLDNEIEKFIITLNIPNCRYQFTIVKRIDSEYFNHIAFHTKEQAEEFLKYPENVQLLKDYFMI